MHASIKAYIAFRYPNWSDYARHHCRVQHLEGWECDLMNDIVNDLMHKPETKLADLMSRETRKIVNGRPTTELDKFVLAMIKMNARSKFASFRKNTVGQKIITTGENVEVVTFCELDNKIDFPESETYDNNRATKLDKMHVQNIERLHAAYFSEQIIKIYKKHFIESEILKSEKEKTIIESITKFLTKKETICLLK